MESTTIRSGIACATSGATVTGTGVLVDWTVPAWVGAMMECVGRGVTGLDGMRVLPGVLDAAGFVAVFVCGSSRGAVDVLEMAAGIVAVAVGCGVGVWRSLTGKITICSGSSGGGGGSSGVPSRPGVGVGSKLPGGSSTASSGASNRHASSAIPLPRHTRPSTAMPIPAASVG